MNCVGQDKWPLWSEIYSALPLGKKILDVLFAFDMKLTLWARKHYQELNTTEEN